MDNQITSAEAYHWATKYNRHRITPHYLDFKNYPVPVKSYDFIDKISLIKNFSSFDLDLNAVFVHQRIHGLSTSFDLTDLSRFLFLAYGVTQTGYANGTSFFFRTTPSAGGLYPCHLYLVVRCMPGLETGLYYCNMIQGFLGLIQRGDPPPPGGKKFSFSLMITAEVFNSSWKYRERAFRYMALDSGHLIENIALALNAVDQSFSIAYDFDDETVSRFLSLDNTKEVPLACVTVGTDDRRLSHQIETGVALSGPRAEQKNVQSSGPAYALLQEIYDLGKTDCRKWCAVSKTPQVLIGKGLKTIHLSDFQALPVDINYMDTVIRRRSKRNFISEALDINTAVDLIRRGSSLFPSDDQAGRVDAYLTVGISCQNVQGLEDGFYLFSRDRSALLLIRKGRFHGPLARVCLDQKWISNAAINFLFMADLSLLEQDAGPRGYRHLLMHSGRMAQRVYLAATGLGLGCCGVGALYDEEAQTLFELNKESALLYVVSAGPVKK
jgi:SagB-type dehydrogenase family enzyme